MQAQPVMSGMVRFVLVGGREGFSGYLGGSSSSKHKFPFSNGICELPFQDAELARKVLSFYSAYPEGSQELEEAQKKWAAQQGADDGSTETSTVHSEVRQAGEESSQGSAAQSSGHAETAEGDTGVLPDRDGPQRASRKMSIPEALSVFDHSKPGQWTTGGKPVLKLVQQLCGDDSITRAEVDEFEVTRKT